jgi:hypothetical protein
MTSDVQRLRVQLRKTKVTAYSYQYGEKIYNFSAVIVFKSRDML